ncbi:Vmc-like lipoprotein signal peptide domain-containing protein [Ureaplasma zalophigenitalium]|uniref:Lipoprotein n=1 Tax=Ureaplasma zalophigenitalium TaxID=907723 RepID=A0ABT3BPD4_9BACT|nr:hypothetical protein [Ureaplasma zalophigenitalium]MCV3754110.1 hypothetical protein [Ureaplasma zalophigenitalium]
MNKKQKRILGFVLAPIGLAAVITPIVTSCSKQDPLQKEFDKAKADYKALFKKQTGQDYNQIIDVLFKSVDEMFKNAKNDAEKKAAIDVVKQAMDTLKASADAIGLKF